MGSSTTTTTTRMVSNGNIKVDSNGKGWRLMKQHTLRVITLTVLGNIGGRLFLNRRSN